MGGGVGVWPAGQPLRAGWQGTDVKRPGKTPCNKKKEKIAICPQFAVAFEAATFRGFGRSHPRLQVP